VLTQISRLVSTSEDLLCLSIARFRTCRCFFNDDSAGGQIVDEQEKVAEAYAKLPPDTSASESHHRCVVAPLHWQCIFRYLGLPFHLVDLLS
jgi:hypothetical protein